MHDVGLQPTPTSIDDTTDSAIGAVSARNMAIDAIFGTPGNTAHLSSRHITAQNKNERWSRLKNNDKNRKRNGWLGRVMK